MIVHEAIAIPMAGGHAFGILARPQAVGRLSALVLPGAGNFGNGGPALLRVIRRLAISGCAALRLDYLGMGESTGGIIRLRATSPRTTDPHAAVQRLRVRGHTNFAVIGLCYGARVAVEVSREMPDVVGVAMLSPPWTSRSGIGAGWTMGELVRRMARPSRWRNLLQREHRRTYWYVIKRFVRSRLHLSRTARSSRVASTEWPPDADLVDALEVLAARGVRVLLVVGEVDKCLAELQRPAADTLRSMFTAPDTDMELVVVPGSVHSFRDPNTVEAVTDVLVEWTDRIASTLPDAPVP